MAPSAHASASRCSVTYCRSWSRVSCTVLAVDGRGRLVDARGDRVAAAAHLDPPLPGGAGQLVVEGLLDAGEAGAVAAHEADHLAADGAGRVQPHRVVLERDARQLERVDGVDGLRGDLGGEDDVPGVLRQLLGELGHRDVEQRRQRQRGAGRVVDDGRVGDHARGVDGVGERPSRRGRGPRRAAPRSGRCAAGPARRRWRRPRRRRPAGLPGGRRPATSSVIITIRPQRLRSPRWSRESPAPLRRLPGARRDVNAPGVPRPPGGRCPVRAIVRPVERGPTVFGTAQPPSVGSAPGAGAGSGVPRRTTTRRAR